MGQPQDSLLGRQLDEYRIEKLLGRGGMAAVYRAHDIKLQRPVALKVIAADFRSDSEYAERFEREAQSIARLDHPNIVRIYRFGEVNGLLYLAMQFVEGADLSWLIREYKRAGETVPIVDVIRVLQDVGAALDYAHSREVIHRDVKSSNIILDNQGRALLTDFGLALLSDEGTQGQVFGSPEYMSPEQAISSGNVVPQSDLYGLGITLFEMLTGELPFTGKQPMDIALRHLSQPVPAPSSYNAAISPAVDAVVLKLLEKEPQNRYQTGAEASAAFDQAIRAAAPSMVNEDSMRRHPSLVSAPEKVRERLQGAVPVNLPPTPPPSQTPPLPSQATVVSATRAHTDKSKQAQLTGTWGRAVGVGAVIFVLGLIGLVLLATSLRNNAIPPSPTPEPTLTATAAVALLPTRTPFQPVIPTALPVTATTEAATAVLPPTVFPTQVGTSYTLLIRMRGEDSLMVANVSPASLPLAPLQLHSGNGAISGSEWGVQTLGNGMCVAAWKDGGNPEAPDLDCSLQGDRITRDGPNRFWKSDFTVFYNGSEVGRCTGDPCTVIFSP